MAKPYQDKELLQRLYYEEDLTQTEIAERMGCCQRTISNWMEKYEIAPGKRFDLAAEASRVPRATYRVTRSGYEIWKARCGDKTRHVSVHRLLAVAEYGFDAVAGKVVHHENGIPWDNRPSNIVPMTPGEHSRHHGGRGDGEPPWRDKDTLRDAYDRMTTREMAEEFGCALATILNWMDRYGIERQSVGGRYD